jgi:hypothetical protein
VSTTTGINLVLSSSRILSSTRSRRGGACSGPVAPAKACLWRCVWEINRYSIASRDHTDAAQDLARDLAEIAHQLASLKGEANAWLSDDNYDTLRHSLEDAHAAVEATTVEARCRVRLNEGR